MTFTNSDGPEACVFGASIICVDALVRLIPGKANFRIQDSNIFLACSLSLSFGVMVSSQSPRLNFLSNYTVQSTNRRPLSSLLLAFLLVVQHAPRVPRIL